MAIEGPLRELGIHDVFQLLDLSRKTGALRVTSDLRDDEGVVLFDGGRVIHASVRSHPTSIERILRHAGKVSDADLAVAASLESLPGEGLGERLVRAGVITQRELERQLRLAIESVVFELLSWQEGFFSFEERAVADVPLDARIRISTESLLMEGARRIDEWSRIADKVPHLGVVPMLAPVEDDRASVLDLLPHEWEVLMMIDATRDLRAIAAALGRSEFEIAKIAYGLVSTGVVELLQGQPVRSTAEAALGARGAAAGGGAVECTRRTRGGSGVDRGAAARRARAQSPGALRRCRGRAAARRAERSAHAGGAPRSRLRGRARGGLRERARQLGAFSAARAHGGRRRPCACRTRDADATHASPGGTRRWLTTSAA